MKLQVIQKLSKAGDGSAAAASMEVAAREESEVWGGGRVFAVGDCTFGKVVEPDPSTGDVERGTKVLLPPVPKICYPGEEQAAHACRNVLRLAASDELPPPERQRTLLMNTWWPWGAGIMSTSLGPKDAVCVIGANDPDKLRQQPRQSTLSSGSSKPTPSGSDGAGKMLMTGWKAAIHKDYIETTKCSECQNGLKGRFIWYLVHHTPINLWGRGPCLVF
ncbi:unnamed protein product [Prorocentrum cordatum]|uniref:Uncharacterized protein n=1 Tax=Prorocentrum cordatum TaxID=2364126 RepID=A0ABN9YCH0_9DINO|nr:unnamed protein product [Polarella glacialis]